jgi:hypothetical protein
MDNVETTPMRLLSRAVHCFLKKENAIASCSAASFFFLSWRAQAKFH